MQLGWIDFSKNERDKVLGVLDSLTEQGTLDELGIAPIRDGFADLFFPGTSTLQTRAKYFLLIPYACKDLEHGDVTNTSTAYTKLYAIERETAEILHRSNPRELGIIGGEYEGKRDWIKRPPSTLYWAGLRRYGIFGGNSSLSEYLKATCALKRDKETLKKLGNRNDAEDCDDKDAGAVQSIRFFSVPTYHTDWKEKLTIQLTREEAEYLKNKIRLSAPDSLLVYLLNTKNRAFFDCNSFEAISSIIDDDKLKADCEMAVGFSNFLYVLRTVYNIVISMGENEQANSEMERLAPNLKSFSDIDIEAIFLRLSIKNDKLKNFLQNSKKAMVEGNIEELKVLVTNRERSIKGSSRAKTMNASSVYADKWIGGGYLDYRLGRVQQLLKDIFDGEADNV